MKTSSTVLAMLLCGGLLPACVQDSPIRVVSIFSPDPDEEGACFEGDPQVQMGGGSLDMAGFGSYILSMQIVSDLTGAVTTSGSDVLGGTGGNNFVVNQMALSYSAFPQQPLEDEALPLLFIIPPGAEEAKLTANIIGPKAAQVLRDSPSPNIQLKVTVTLQGKLESGTPMAASPFTYPINVYRSAAVTCGAGDRFVRNGPCGGVGGQDGRPLLCCAQSPMHDSCT